MSTFPQIIWRPSLKDVAAELAPRSFIQRITGNAAAVSVGVSSPADMIARDQVLILTHCLGFGDPGAAQVLQFMQLNILGDNQIITVLAGASTFPVAVAGLPGFITWQGELVLTNTESLQLSTLFDLGVATNFASLSIGGFIVPRGNWQR